MRANIAAIRNRIKRIRRENATDAPAPINKTEEADHYVEDAASMARYAGAIDLLTKHCD